MMVPVASIVAHLAGQFPLQRRPNEMLSIFDRDKIEALFAFPRWSGSSRNTRSLPS
jgi:hypothetical protein